MAAISVFRSQSFLSTISISIELDNTQKRISAQAGLQILNKNKSQYKNIILSFRRNLSSLDSYGMTKMLLE